MTMMNDSMKSRSFIEKILVSRKIGRRLIRSSSDSRREEHPTSELERLALGDVESKMPVHQDVQPFRVYVATWNVGGKTPNNDLDLCDFLRVHHQSDFYVLGFQEVVPLNAGNVLVLEDNEPAAKWLALINQALNKSHKLETFKQPSYPSDKSHFFQKPSLKTYSKNFRTESRRRLKSCNCITDFEKKYSKESCFRCQQSNISEDDISSEDDDGSNSFAVSEMSSASDRSQMKYGLVASKRMVGIFVTVWAKREHIQHLGHLRISSITRGIMGCLGNKGCISVSMTFHQTSLCFICSHLASGEKEGDERRRNLDVIEIIKNTQFTRICRMQCTRVPERILEHDRIIWFGDLNYRIALSYFDTKKLLEENDWDTLLAKDQLKIEREAGRVFNGWKEGKIYFAPTYKYSYGSDTYAGDATTSKNKRRTPAWCDRILWHGNGIRQLAYIRGESRFSDHRPVCAVFLVDIKVNQGSIKHASSLNLKVGAEELLSMVG